MTKKKKQSVRDLERELLTALLPVGIQLVRAVGNAMSQALTDHRAGVKPKDRVEYIEFEEVKP